MGEHVWTAEEIRAELEAVCQAESALEARRHAVMKAALELPADKEVVPRWMAESIVDQGLRLDALPFEVLAIKRSTAAFIKRPLRHQPGTWVAVRTCAKEHEGKTYLGLLVGSVAMGSSLRFYAGTGVLEVAPCWHNPAIWIPDLQQYVRGAGSWWRALRRPEDLEQITDADIDNTWYVRALKSLEGEGHA